MKLVYNAAAKKLLSDNLSHHMSMRVFDKVSKEMVARGRRNAPVKTGALRDSISRRKLNRGYLVYTHRKIKYAKPIYWGWPKRGIERTRFFYDSRDTRTVVKEFVRRLENMR